MHFLYIIIKIIMKLFLFGSEFFFFKQKNLLKIILLFYCLSFPYILLVDNLIKQTNKQTNK